MKSTFEKIGGTYTLGADGIYYPNLVSTDEEPHYGKYGMIRKTYLKEHRPAMYSLYMLEDRPYPAPETAAVRPAASGNMRKWKTACARKAPTAAAEFDGRNL